jgi:Lon protease-like protein
LHNEECPPGFAETCRLFPLPGLVFFPHAVLPLHIFEPRYRQMIEDALATDNLITMVQLKPGGATASRTEPPPIEDVGCLGKIIRYERLLDGRFNLLLVGLKRVRIRTELSAQKLYRIAAAEVIEDLPSERPESPLRSLLIQRFRSEFETAKELDPDLRTLLDSDTIDLGALTDIIAHALAIPPPLKQVLLAESAVDRRVGLLLRVLGEAANDIPEIPSRSFPPPFSLN